MQRRPGVLCRTTRRLGPPSFYRDRGRLHRELATGPSDRNEVLVRAHDPIGAVVARALDEAVVRTSRSSGPGGQHANVTSSRVEAVLDVAGSRALSEEQRARVLARAGPRVTGVAQDARSQSRNRELALERLAGRLRAALAIPRPRTPTRPTRSAKLRRLEEKRRTGERKRARRRPLADEPEP
jgi:ribosome-associated protein